jgi:hypothetical protein
MGWGDSLISLFDILNCSDYIKKHYPDVEISLIINDCASKNINNIFPQVFDVDFFKSFFNDILIQEKNFINFSNDNKMKFNNENFIRIFSGRNGDLNPNIPGIFDTYVNEEFVDDIKLLNIPFNDFVFNSHENEIINDYPIFNEKIIKIVDDFVNTELKNDFISVHYRIGDAPSDDEFGRIDSVKDILSDKLSKNDSHFFLTNHGIVKQKLLSVIPNCKVFIDSESHSDEMINGYRPNDRMGLNDSIISIIELLIISKSKIIYTYSDYGWISYFTFYARKVKNVPYKEIINL